MEESTLEFYKMTKKDYQEDYNILRKEKKEILEILRMLGFT